MENIYTCKEVAARYYVEISTVLEWIKKASSGQNRQEVPY